MREVIKDGSYKMAILENNVDTFPGRSFLLGNNFQIIRFLKVLEILT